MSNTYPRETIEFIPVTVTVDGVVVTSGVQFAVTTSPSARPTDWAAPTVLDGKVGVMTSTQPVGVYCVWAKVTDSPEAPVIFCGQYQVT